MSQLGAYEAKIHLPQRLRRAAEKCQVMLLCGSEVTC